MVRVTSVNSNVSVCFAQGHFSLNEIVWLLCIFSFGG